MNSYVSETMKDHMFILYPSLNSGKSYIVIHFGKI